MLLDIYFAKSFSDVFAADKNGPLRVQKVCACADSEWHNIFVLTLFGNLKIKNVTREPSPLINCLIPGHFEM
jgi:hypothetical protein